MTVANDKNARVEVVHGSYKSTGEILGEGGYGTVLLIVSEELGGLKLAAKVLLHEHAKGNPEAVRRFKQEAMILGRVRHPHIVKIVDVITLEDGRPAIIMEHLDGKPLSERLRRTTGKRLSIVEVVSIINDTCAAVACAHEHGVVHRDLKPENIFFHHPDPDNFKHEVLKVLDFGIAKMHDEDANAYRTRTGEVLGTCQYMAPEQILGETTIDYRADVYSLGIILFELLTGMYPFRGGTIPQWILAHANKAPKPLNERMLEQGAEPLHESWQHVIDGALAKEADDRFASVADFARAVNAAAQGQLVEGPRKKPQVGKRTLPAKPKKKTLLMPGHVPRPGAVPITILDNAADSHRTKRPEAVTLPEASAPSASTLQPPNSRVDAVTAAARSDAPIATVPPIAGEHDNQAVSVGAPTLPPNTLPPNTLPPNTVTRGPGRLVAAVGFALVAVVIGLVVIATRGSSKKQTSEPTHAATPLLTAQTKATDASPPPTKSEPTPKPKPTPTKKTQVVIKTKPPGGLVVIDNQPAQKAPFTTRIAPKKTIRVRGTLAGYRPAEKRVPIPDQERFEFTLKLQPKPRRAIRKRKPKPPPDYDPNTPAGGYN